MIIAISGLIGSGKDTVADYLVNLHEFRRESFAGNLKNAMCEIFGWDRDMEEGRSKSSREWREQVDEWWAKRLNMPHLTPRWILQHVGTDVIRGHFHDDMWLASLENKLRKTDDIDNLLISLHYKIGRLIYKIIALLGRSRYLWWKRQLRRIRMLVENPKRVFQRFKSGMD